METVKNRFKFDCELVIMMIFILTGSFFLTLNISPIIYWGLIHVDNLEINLGLTPHLLERDYFSLLNYLEDPFCFQLRLFDFKSSSMGLHHFLEVRHLFLLNNLMGFITFIISDHILLRLKHQGELWKMIQPIDYILVSIFVLGGMILINFQAAFIKFHQIVFRNHDWVFNPKNDPIIKALPVNLFSTSFICFGILVIILLLVLYYYSRHEARQNRG